VPEVTVGQTRWSLVTSSRAPARFRVTFRRVIAVAGALGAGAIAYGTWVRPRLTGWGATDEEITGPYPGAEIVPGGEKSGAMSVTIDAPPEQVWPWLVQLGGDRAGWYSWDRLDNAGRPSARRVHPEWQQLAVGDHVRYLTRRYGPVDAWQVAALEPNRFLGLHGVSDLRGRPLDPEQPRPRAYTEGLWGFLLNELPGGRTRLVISGYQTIRPRWLQGFFYGWLLPPVVWIMQARMLAVLKRNVEQAAGASPARPAGASPGTTPCPRERPAAGWRRP
jgi:proline iminopeptidase